MSCLEFIGASVIDCHVRQGWKCCDLQLVANRQLPIKFIDNVFGRINRIHAYADGNKGKLREIKIRACFCTSVEIISRKTAKCWKFVWGCMSNEIAHYAKKLKARKLSQKILRARLTLKSTFLFLHAFQFSFLFNKFVHGNVHIFEIFQCNTWPRVFLITDIIFSK